MATTIATINEALLDERVIPALRNVLPMLSSFSLRVDTDGERIVDDTMYVPLSTDPTGGTKTAGTIVSATGSLTGKLVTLDTLYGAGFDAVEGKMSPALMEQYWADKAVGGVYVCAKAIIDSALALVTASNFGNEDEDKLQVSSVDFGQNDLALLWAKAETKIKQRERSIGLNAAYAAGLLGNSALGLVLATSGSNFISTGVVPQLMGMPSWAYASFPSNSENLGGAVFGKAAIAVGIARIGNLMATGDGNIMYRRDITDPDSGITATLTVTGDGGGTMKGEVAILYGVAVGQNSVVRIVSA